MRKWVNLQLQPAALKIPYNGADDTLNIYYRFYITGLGKSIFITIFVDMFSLEPN
jgi:hypothetical protein